MNLRQLAQQIRRAMVAAARNDDVDAALAPVMQLLGQTAGDVARHMFDSDEWVGLAPQQRMGQLKNWLTMEVTEALSPLGVQFAGKDITYEAADEPVEEAFDPYTDPETRRMLERAGVATHRHRH